MTTPSPPVEAPPSPLADPRLRAFFEALPAECYLIDPETLLCVDCNAEALRRSGFSREELVGRRVTDGVATVSDAAARRLAARALAGELVQRETRHRTKADGVRDVLVTIRQLRVADERPLVISVVVDISDRRRWEARVQASEARFRALYDDSPVAAMVSSLDDLRIVDCNDACLRLLGLAHDEVVGRPVTSVVASHGEAELRALRASLPSGDVLRLQVGLRTRTGEVRDVLYVGREIVMDGLRLSYGTLVDITDLKAAEQELRRSAVFEQRIVGVVSHDLRNPLSAIALRASVALRDTNVPTRTRDALTRILTTAQRALRMIRDLLDSARARHRTGIPLRLGPVDLAAVAREAVDEVLSASPGREVRVAASGDLHGTWDRERLVQVVSNLVTNAVKFGPDDAPIEVTLRGAPDAVSLVVHNQGPAIPAASLATLFDAFRQGDDATAGGVGLGLFIVRHLVEAHHGTVQVASDDAAGTTFTVRLPRTSA